MAMNNALTNAPANGGRNSGWKLPLKIFTAIFEPTSKAPLKGLRNPDTYFYHSFTFQSQTVFSVAKPAPGRRSIPYKFNVVPAFFPLAGNVLSRSPL